MRTFYQLLILLGFVSFFSCSKDCTPPVIEQNIIGSWTGTATANGQIKAGGNATFNSDHTGTSPGEIFQASFNGGPKIKDFTWEVDSVDNNIGLTYDDSGSSFTIFYQVQSNKCNTIILELGFLGTATLNRN